MKRLPKRIRTLYHLIDSAQPPVLVTTIEAVLQRLIPRSVLSRYAELIQKGEEIDRDQLITKLIGGGYFKTAIVEEPGDFSIPGGIIDIFSATYSDPIRIEMVGDRVEALRFFCLPPADPSTPFRKPSFCRPGR
jgi:transcription-repair coupling factor (superfamily II helicase)